MTQHIEAEKALQITRRFLTGKLNQSGLTGYVVGLSGGIDSAVSAALAVAAVGKEKVFGLLMPYRSSSPSSSDHAAQYAHQLGIETTLVDISPMIDAYFGTIDPGMRVRAGNKMARERMSILFDHAHRTNRLVLGTGNRTEICLGYTTWFGDSACSLNPIGELYKTEVRALARLIGVPPAIIAKAPTADLWEGQTDEGEIGLGYDRLDQLLALIVDRGMTSMQELQKAGFTSDEVSRVVSLMNRNYFKRALPDIAPLGRSPIPVHLQLRA